MPIWLELTVLSLASYGLGVAAGWAVWGTAQTDEPEEDDTP